MNEKLYYLWLDSISGVGNKTFIKLIDYFESPKNIYNANTHDFREIDNLKDTTINNIINAQNEQYLEQILKKLEKYNVRTVTILDNNYPEELRFLENPPNILYIRGELDLCNLNGLAIVGSRRPRQQGKKIAYDISKDIASKGIVVISGLASGIDYLAHKGALDAKGKTVAVLGCSVDICYPSSHDYMMRKIIEQGSAVISEYPLGTSPVAGNFPNRNRIISGLSNGVLVVEAAENSGTFITVNHALDQGKQVYAIPGDIYDSKCKGTNYLIKQGATPITCASDLYYDLKISETTNIEYNHTEEEEYILSIINDRQPIHYDVLLSLSKYDINKTMSIVTMLEINEAIEKLSGNILIKK